MRLLPILTLPYTAKTSTQPFRETARPKMLPELWQGKPRRTRGRTGIRRTIHCFLRQSRLTTWVLRGSEQSRRLSSLLLSQFWIITSAEKAQIPADGRGPCLLCVDHEHRCPRKGMVRGHCQGVGILLWPQRQKETMPNGRFLELGLSRQLVFSKQEL